MKTTAWEITTAPFANAIKARVNRYYENARIDYGVEGECLAVMEKGNAISIIGMEGGKYTVCEIPYYREYTGEQLFNIWMER